MKLTELLMQELDAEVERSRRVLEHVPDGKADWKPHEKSMAFGSIAAMVAIIPSWVSLIVDQDELDVAPATPRHRPAPMQTSAEYLKALDGAAAGARKSLQATTDEHLMTPWKMLARGQLVHTASRYDNVRDAFSHLSHHRGQLTVYLRLVGSTVPAVFGPSADDKRFLT